MAATGRSGSPSTSPVRALVVDDDPMVRKTLVRVLTSLGLAPAEAANGR